MRWKRNASTSISRSSRPRPTAFRRILDILLAAAILVLIALIAGRLEILNTIRREGSVRVSDGDSLELNGTRIRLLGIDAPELSQSCSADGGAYPCGRESKNMLQRLTNGVRVKCEGRQLDRYGRLLATCTANGVNLNLRQVETGWAIAYGDYSLEENLARTGRRGIWSGDFERPRDWRTQQGGATEFEHDFIGRVVLWLQQLVGF